MAYFIAKPSQPELQLHWPAELALPSLKPATITPHWASEQGYVKLQLKQAIWKPNRLKNIYLGA